MTATITTGLYIQTKHFPRHEIHSDLAHQHTTEFYLARGWTIRHIVTQDYLGRPEELICWDAPDRDVTDSDVVAGLQTELAA